MKKRILALFLTVLLAFVAVAAIYAKVAPQVVTTVRTRGLPLNSADICTETL